MIFPFNFILPKWRTGSALSRIFRNIFESKQIKKVIGLNLAFIIMFTGSLSPVLGAVAQEDEKQQVIEINKIVLKTEETFQKPVVGEISQGYHWYHPGIDIANNKNEQVYPVATGKVVEIGYQVFGYGNYVVVKHGDDVTSLYGHLKSINVGPQQEIKKDTVLGIVGSTGHSTGPHLHLEISFNGTRVNPFSVIEELN